MGILGSVYTLTSLIEDMRHRYTNNNKNMNSNSDLMSSMSEVSVYTDPNIPTASADSKFNNLGVNRFYSPNMARRRSYVFEQMQPCGSSDVSRRYVASPDTT